MARKLRESPRYDGTPLTVILTIIFIVLKLVGVIDWNWWIVLSPALFNLVVAIIFVIAVGIIYGVEK